MCMILPMYPLYKVWTLWGIYVLTIHSKTPVISKLSQGHQTWYTRLNSVEVVKSDRCHLVIYTVSEISPYIKVCHRWHQVFGNNWTDHYTSSHNFSCHTHTRTNIKRPQKMAHSTETIPLMAFSEGKSWGAQLLDGQANTAHGMHLSLLQFRRALWQSKHQNLSAIHVKL